MGLFKPQRSMQRTRAEELDRHMREILGAYPGSKLTLVIRSERFDKPIIITNDSQADAIKAMREMMPGSTGLMTAGS